MKNISKITIFIILFLFAFSFISFSQSNNYEKKILFTLEWGNNSQQIGYREDNNEGKTGPTNYTVTSNNLIWIYDVVQNSIKAFNYDGKMAYIFKLLENAGTEGFINSDIHNNIWFHDAWNRRILMLNQYGELQYSIKYESENVLGSISVRNGKQVLWNKVVDIKRNLTNNGYANKPEYEALLIVIDSESILHPLRGEKTNRVYRVTSVDISNEGEIIPPRLFVNNKMVQGFDFEEEINKNYNFFFIREDILGNFFIFLIPNSWKKIFLLI